MVTEATSAPQCDDWGKSGKFLDKYTDKGMTNKKDSEGFVRAAKDITAGSVGGIAQVLTGQPFDIVKVFTLSSQTNRLRLGTAANATIVGTSRVCGCNRLCEENSRE
jgi:hypothetical protein